MIRVESSHALALSSIHHLSGRANLVHALDEECAHLLGLSFASLSCRELLWLASASALQPRLTCLIVCVAIVAVVK